MKYAPLWIIVIALISCKNEKPTSATEQSAPPAVKPEVYLYMATVDNLRLREAPNQSAKVVAQIAEGDFAEGGGTISENREEIELRGRYFNEPYILVTTTTPEQQKGWAYGGGLVLVYAGSRAESPDLGRLAQYAAFLKGLPIKQVESGKKAWDYLRANFKDAKGALADAAFIMTDYFLGRLDFENEFFRVADVMEWTEKDYNEVGSNQFDYARYPITQNLPAAGFRLETAEGSIFPVPDWKQYEAFFVGKTTPAMADFIRQRTYENLNIIWSDGALLAPIEKIVDRAGFWENFNNRYPHFVLNEETNDSEKWMRFLVVSGSDNTPTYDWETKVIHPEFRKAWEYAQKKYPNTRLAAHVKEMMDLCARNNWKYADEVRLFIEKQWNEQAL